MWVHILPELNPRGTLSRGEVWKKKKSTIPHYQHGNSQPQLQPNWFLAQMTMFKSRMMSHVE